MEPSQQGGIIINQQTYIHTVLNCIDHDLVEQAAVPTVKRVMRPVRIAVIAACLCIVLIGTAFAVDEVYDLFSKLFFSEAGTAHELNTTVAQYPVDSFSDALLESSENRGTLAVVEQEFDTWEEVRAFIGPNVDLVWPNAESWQGRYQVCLFHTGSDNLWGISIESTDTNAQASISLDIYTEHRAGSTVTQTTVYSSEDTVEQLEPYTTAAGLSAELILIKGPESHPDVQCAGSFTRMGVIYSVKTYGTLNTQEETVLRLLTLLDCFG